MRYLLLLAALAPSVALAAPGAECAKETQFRGASAYAAMSPKFNLPAGGGKSPCHKLFEIDDRVCRPVLPILFEYFGEDVTCPAEFTARYSDRPHLLEIHYSDEACRKSHSCHGRGVFLPGFSESQYSKALEVMAPLTRQGVVDRVEKILALVEQIRLPNTEVALSVGLEESLSAKARSNLVKVVRENWPFLIVQTGGSPAKGDFKEFHSRSAKTDVACFANEDGLDQSASKTRSFVKHYARCFAVMAFRDRWQGRVGAWKKLDPSERDFDYSNSDIRLVGDALAQ